MKALSHRKPFQTEIVCAVSDALQKGHRRMLCSIVTGVERTRILVELIRKLYEEQRIRRFLVLMSTKTETMQFSDAFYKMMQSQVSYSDLRMDYRYFSPKESVPILAEQYECILCTAPERMKEQLFLYIIPETIVIGISNSKHIDFGLLKGAICVYRYAKEAALADGELSPFFEPGFRTVAAEGFCKKLLMQLDSEFLLPEAWNDERKQYDVLIFRGSQTVFIQCKLYRDKDVPFHFLEQSLHTMHTLGSPSDVRLLILFGRAAPEEKKQAFERYGVVVWDIENLLFYAQNDVALSERLRQLVQFPLSGIAVAPSPYWSPAGKASSYAPSPSIEREWEKHERLLKQCKQGIKFFEEYENICFDILQYLFKDEFSQVRRQHSTNDELFRMDTLCSLKGTSAFWQWLIQHYNSCFVVFEYKNHSRMLEQNLIYTTEKYLFHAALRNVAIMISRKGFSEHARQAAEGCLKENGKLILDVTDEDLIRMLHKKAKGEEPADLLLDKLENFLMSIGK